MWPSNKDIPLFTRVPVIMNHRVVLLIIASRANSVVNSAVRHRSISFGTVDVYRRVGGDRSIINVDITYDVFGGQSVNRRVHHVT